MYGVSKVTLMRYLAAILSPLRQNSVIIMSKWFQASRPLIGIRIPAAWADIDSIRLYTPGLPEWKVHDGWKLCSYGGNAGCLGRYLFLSATS